MADYKKMFAEQGFNCAESVLVGATGCDDCLNLASGFGGGIARRGSVCGAVTGAVMALGQLLAVRAPDSSASPRDLQEATATMIDQFREEFGSDLCRELIPYDLSRREELQAFREDPEGKERCLSLVERAVELVKEVSAGYV